jgi:hypothetical protein
MGETKLVHRSHRNVMLNKYEVSKNFHLSGFVVLSHARSKVSGEDHCSKPVSAEEKTMQFPE